MNDTKQYLGNLLKELGANEKQVSGFQEAFENDMQAALNKNKEEVVSQVREEHDSKLPTIQDLAAKHNIRNK